jgi:hypothetical protein
MSHAGNGHGYAYLRLNSFIEFGGVVEARSVSQSLRVNLAPTIG